MAKRQVWIGSLGPFNFDDSNTFKDGSEHGLRVSKAPSEDDEVIRKVDAGTVYAPHDAQYIVVALDGVLTKERRLQVGSGLTLTDNGANNDLDIDVDEANIDHDSLQNFNANEHIDWTNAVNSFKTTKNMIWPLVSESLGGVDVDDYDISDGYLFKLTSSANINVSGFQNGVDGRALYLFNVGGNNIILTNEDSGSTAANRFHVHGAANLTLQPDDAAKAFYDTDINRWRVFEL